MVKTFQNGTINEKDVAEKNPNFINNASLLVCYGPYAIIGLYNLSRFFNNLTATPQIG
jgi:hypothetical protein